MSITLTSAQFDKSSYAPGDLVTLTIGYSSTDTLSDPNAGSQQYAVSLALTDSTETVNPGPTQAPPTVYTVDTPATMADPITVAATEARYPQGGSTGRTWNLVSTSQLTYDSATGTSTWQSVLTVQLPLD